MTYTPIEAEQIHYGTMSALAAISETRSSGLFGMWKEGKAGGAFLKRLPEPLRSAVIGTDAEPEGFEPPATQTLEGDLGMAVGVVAARTPELVDTYKRGVIEAVEAAAAAAKGISPEEQQVIDQVKAILS